MSPLIPARRCEFQGGLGREEKYRPPSPCLGEFEPKAANQKYCEVCQPFADLDRMADWRTAHRVAPMKVQCEFQGGRGLEEKYHPPSPCLGEFVRTAPNQKYCMVCQPFAKQARNTLNANAAYKAAPAKHAKRTRENRWKRRKAAGRPVRRIGTSWFCEYRNKDGKRGDRCQVKFIVRGASQRYCDVCQRHADADRAQNYRDTHHDDLLVMYRKKGKTLRQQAKQGKIIEKVRNLPVIQQMIALYLELHPETPSDSDVRRVFGDVSKSTILRGRTQVGMSRKTGRPRKVCKASSSF
jgi:hypothetical protein